MGKVRHIKNPTDKVNGFPNQMVKQPQFGGWTREDFIKEINSLRKEVKKKYRENWRLREALINRSQVETAIITASALFIVCLLVFMLR